MPSSLTDPNLQHELRDLLSQALAGPAGNRDAYLLALSRLDAIARDSTVRLSGDLRHYLAKRSYGKAWNVIDNPANAS